MADTPFADMMLKRRKGGKSDEDDATEKDKGGEDKGSSDEPKAKASEDKAGKEEPAEDGSSLLDKIIGGPDGMEAGDGDVAEETPDDGTAVFVKVFKVDEGTAKHAYKAAMALPEMQDKSAEDIAKAIKGDFKLMLKMLANAAEASDYEDSMAADAAAYDEPEPPADAGMGGMGADAGMGLEVGAPPVA